VTFAALDAAGPSPWLSQGDIFSKVLIAQAGVVDGMAQAVTKRGPALLMTHGCALDKKRKAAGREVSRLEYLSFLPILSVEQLPPERAEPLRTMGNEGQPTPYEALYLGDVPEVGEAYVALGQPYTVPALFLRTELEAFTAEQTGDVAETRVVPTINDERVAMLSPEGLDLLSAKWLAFWLGKKPKQA